MQWVTRSHVHVDRVACPWLILRFIDSEAKFLFVPKSQVLAVAEREGAISFDSPGAQYHHDGDLCTFSVLIREYALTDKALLRLAKIVNAADSGQLDQDPYARGLEAIAVGFALRFPDDAVNLQKQYEVYDALYAWCRLQTMKE
ncbi:MAG: chromate resistance protein [Magnetococcales bacterium]|nr:chromate resistance protein [Magnetococcales bacterium]